MKALIRLFKAVEIESHNTKKSDPSILNRTLKNGFVFSPEIVGSYSEEHLHELATSVEEELGLSSEQINSAFHKSWQKVRDADMTQLIMEQMIHYFTTYGFERLGIYNEASVYIPAEKLEAPDFGMDGMHIIPINGYTKNEIKDKLISLLESGIALAEDTVKDVVEVFKHFNIVLESIDDVKNKEVRISLCDHLGVFPKDPVEFLRYAIYKATGKTLLIKSGGSVEGIKEGEDVYPLFTKYQEMYGLERLAEIFYRFKPLFLAFKTKDGMPAIINKIRKLAPKYHQPMPVDFLNSVTAIIKSGSKIDDVVLEHHLAKVNTFRKIRLAYALKYRTKDVDTILYKIRNGKGYATDFSFENKDEARRVLTMVIDSIIADLKENVEGKKIYIPGYVKYALPATEKQFTGDFPSGTCIISPKDMVAGIQWKNTEDHRIDLDLSLINITGNKIGWDAAYRSDGGSILFSGDITDAHRPKGASELFAIRKQSKQEYLMFVNFFNYMEDVEVPFNIVVAQEKITRAVKNHVLDPNNIMAIAKSKIDERQKVLGLLVVTTGECRFYFSEIGIGRSISVGGGNNYVEHSLLYLSNFYRNMMNLGELLSAAGAIVLTSIDDSENIDIDIDLSPNNLEKDKIIKLLS